MLSSVILVPAVLNGLMTGAVYALIALGLTLIYGVLHIINFAHGALLTAAMFAAFFAHKLLGLDPYVAALGLTPRARFVNFSLAGADPRMMLTAPIPATEKVFARAGMTINDIELMASGNLIQAGNMIGQRIMQQIGQTGIPVYNVANACDNSSRNMSITCCDASIRNSRASNWRASRVSSRRIW